MLSLKGRQDQYRLLLPEDLIPEEITDKYTKILTDRHSLITKPIDFVNESIQKIQVLGFNGGTVPQQQSRRGASVLHPGDPKFEARNNMLGGSAEFAYRTVANPQSLLDNTLNIDFRHTLGYLNYFILFESFFYQNTRDMTYDKLPKNFNIEICNEGGEVYSKIVLFNPLIDGMDMLDLDFSQPIAQSQTFRTIFKYTDIDFQFIETDFVSSRDKDNPVTKDDFITK